MQNIFNIGRIIRITGVCLDIKEYFLLIGLVNRSHIPTHLHLFSVIPLVVLLQAYINMRGCFRSCIVCLHVSSFHDICSRSSKIRLVFFYLNFFYVLVLFNAFKRPLRRSFWNSFWLSWFHTSFPLVFSVSKNLCKLLITLLGDR